MKSKPDIYNTSEACLSITDPAAGRPKTQQSSKNSKAIRFFRACYRFLDRFSPVDSDCGLLCSAACCHAKQADTEMGIFLLPGEELMQKDAGWLALSTEKCAEYELPASWGEEFTFAKCPEPDSCRRMLRPLQCRTFPLMPYISEAGELTMLYNDSELPYECPLIEDEIPLNDDFVMATRTVWKHLMRDQRVRDMVIQDSEALRELIDEELD